MNYDNVKIPAMTAPAIGHPYLVLYPWGHEYHVRVRGGGIKKVRGGWARMWFRKQFNRRRR